MASRALISQLLADSRRCRMRGTAGDGPKRRLGSGIGLSRSRQPLSNRDAVSADEGPHNGDIVRVSGRCQLVCHGSVVMAGWRCPQRGCFNDG